MPLLFLYPSPSPHNSHPFQTIAKIFPQRIKESLSMSLERETFTLLMKSLVCHTNGCTVFNSNGEIVYRVDNYDKKSRNVVFLMDLRGTVIVTIRRKRFRIPGEWYGCRLNALVPWFQVKRYFRLCTCSLACQVTVGLDKYWVKKMAPKATFRIVDINGDAMAEMKLKQTSSGITFGDDVLTLTVEPRVDHSLVMGIVIVHGLMNGKL